MPSGSNGDLSLTSGSSCTLIAASARREQLRVLFVLLQVVRNRYYERGVTKKITGRRLCFGGNCKRSKTALVYVG
jgi:hypothetical protein